jgi:HK97 gp10 family phage protein
MAGSVVGVFGINQIQAQLAQGLAQMTEKIDKAVQKAGLDCERYAKQRCPVDTGNLRASLHYENTGLQQCIVGTNVEYAPFVELGTSRQAAQPYLYPAYEQAKSELISALKGLRIEQHG